MISKKKIHNFLTIATFAIFCYFLLSVYTNITTQKQNNATYDAALAKYNQDLATWKASLQNADNSIDPRSVTQDLFLGDESEATLSVKWSQTVKVYGQSNNMGFGDYPNAITGKTVNAQSPVEVGEFSSGTHSGTIAVATYTNLKHSYYLDPLDNNKKKGISKIVYTWGNITQNTGDVGDSYFEIYQNMSIGAALINGKSVQLTNIQFYDENGNEIQIQPGTAWFMSGSMNVWGQSTAYPYVEHREKVYASGANKIYEVAAPKGVKMWSTKNADGGVYPEPNASGGYQGSGYDWDTGIAIIQYNPGGTITFAYDQVNDFSVKTYTTTDGVNHWDGATNWYQFGISTYLTTSAADPAPTKPTRKTTSVSYHYLVLAIFR